METGGGVGSCGLTKSQGGRKRKDGGALHDDGGGVDE